MKYLQLARLKTEGEPYYEDPEDEAMAISLAQIKDELYPGLAAVRGSYCDIKEQWAAQVFNQGTTWTQTLAAPHIWIPKPVIIMGGIAAVVANNPHVLNVPVTRRFWAGWFSGGAK